MAMWMTWPTSKNDHVHLQIGRCPLEVRCRPSRVVAWRGSAAGHFAGVDLVI